MYKNILFPKNIYVFALKSIKYNLEPHKIDVLTLTREFSIDPYVVFM